MQFSYHDLSDNFNRLFAGLTYTLHSALLTYYLIVLNVTNNWFIWIIFDVFVILLMVYAFTVTYIRKRSHVTSGLINRLLNYNYPGQLPFGFWIWILIGLSSGIRIGILFRSFVGNLSENQTYGPTLLQVTIGLLGPLYFFVVKSVRLRTGTRSFGYEEDFFVIFECTNLLDATDILINLYPTSSMNDSLKVAIIVVAILFIFIPLLHLAKYTQVTYNKPFTARHMDLAVGLEILQCIIGLLGNIALLILRLIIWRAYLITISGQFIVKEIFFCYVILVRTSKFFINKHALYDDSEI